MNRLPYEAGWKRKKASQVSWTWVIREKKMGELVDFVLMLPILGTRFCYMIWLVRSMTVDKWVMIIEWISSSFHEKYLHAHECYWSQSIEPQKKKHYNFTGLICTLLTCYRPMCYRIQWVDTWDQNKAFRLLHLFFSPRPCLAPVICHFFCHFFCTAPLRSLFADYINTI